MDVKEVSSDVLKIIPVMAAMVDEPSVIFYNVCLICWNTSIIRSCRNIVISKSITGDPLKSYKIASATGTQVMW